MNGPFKTRSLRLWLYTAMGRETKPESGQRRTSDARQ
jgi:hypothetical protein